MEKFTYNDYYTECPIAVRIEDIINGSGSVESNISKILNSVFHGDGVQMNIFFRVCIGYWSETEYYDDRNKYAVFASRKLMEHSEAYREIVKQAEHCPDIMLNAFGFTMSAHRYLQNKLFKLIETHFADEEEFVWFRDSQFVYTDEGEYIPWEEYTRKYQFEW